MNILLRKTLLYRVINLVVIGMIVFLITKNVEEALKLSLVVEVTKTVLYLVYEYFWELSH